MVTLHILREGETQPVATWLSWGSLSALGESQESHWPQRDEDTIAPFA
jgi:hypothetical protein